MKFVAATHADITSPITAIEEDHITRVIEASGRFYEIDLLEAIARLKVQGAYVDIGAHVGNHSVFFALHCPAFEIHAFEPNVAVQPALEDNAARYQFRFHDHAVHDEHKDVQILDEFPGNHGMAVAVQAAPSRATAKAVRLDDYLNPLLRLRVGLIKVDVECAELPALRSGMAIIHRDRPVIAAEAQKGPEEIDGLLSGLNYQRRPGRFCATPTYLWMP